MNDSGVSNTLQFVYLCFKCIYVYLSLIYVFHDLQSGRSSCAFIVCVCFNYSKTKQFFYGDALLPQT